MHEPRGPREEPSDDEAERAGRALFAGAIFAAAFLLFLVQPIVGKRILPWFGGVPSVWTLCLAFYQSMLFLGYAYAHLLIRARPELQVGLYAAAIGAALIALPVLPGDAWKPRPADDPSTQVLLLLTANVALPFLVLASTGPLIQSWFARRYPQRSPYPLYALSNVGSLLALLAYPFLIEPRFALSGTGTGWSWAFSATAATLLGCAFLAGRTGGVGERPASFPFEGRGRPDHVHVALWFSLAGCAVLLLMGVTNRLCLDIASVPFLWILPLTTYLVTFIFCFSSERSYRRAPYVVLALLALPLAVGWLPSDSFFDPQTRSLLKTVYVQIPNFCALLFALCMILHGELYRLRPAPHALTAFYLCVSGGGALGGIFVGVLAPVVFDRYLEFEIGLALAGLLFLVACFRDPASALGAGAPLWRRVGAGLATLALIVGAAWQTVSPSEGLLYQERSFFGVLRVFESGEEGRAQRRLRSGSTLHGVQFLGPAERRLPTSYFGRATGLGLLMASRDPQTRARIGVIGLGVGTLAAYGHAGDVVRFYEIDPVVVRIAREDGYFSFLADSPARVEVTLGDARLALAEEQAAGHAQSFDVLVVDAFTSDAIPVHLLTREAFAHYARALAPGGLLAVHVSNRHFELMPLVSRLGLEFGFESIQVRTGQVPRLQSQSASWVFLARDARRIDGLAKLLARRHRALGISPQLLHVQRPRREAALAAPVWTDDYSDLFGVLRPMH